MREQWQFIISENIYKIIMYFDNYELSSLVMMSVKVIDPDHLPVYCDYCACLPSPLSLLRAPRCISMAGHSPLPVEAGIHGSDGNGLCYLHLQVSALYVC